MSNANITIILCVISFVPGLLSGLGYIYLYLFNVNNHKLERWFEVGLLLSAAFMLLDLVFTMLALTVGE